VSPRGLTGSIGRGPHRGLDALSKVPASVEAVPSRKIRRRDFDEGDLVLRLCQDNRGRHKLSPPWEGPYGVVKVLKPDTYKLANEDGEEVTKSFLLFTYPTP
jgi:protein-tyrosine-phosphatase